jgi:hypothetical protein
VDRVLEHIREFRQHLEEHLRVMRHYKSPAEGTGTQKQERVN